MVSLSLRYVSSQFFFLYHIYIHTYIYICYLVQSKDRHRRLVNLHVLETFILTHCQSFYNVSPFFFFFYPLSNTSHSLFFSNKKKSLSSLSISFVCLFVFLKRKKWIRMQKMDWSKTVLFYEQFIHTIYSFIHIDDVLFSKSFFKPISLFLFRDLDLFYDEEKNKRNVICFI